MESFVTGATIRILREQKGLTQAALAEKICVSDKTVSKWETGKGLPDISLLEPLASALGISVAELFAGEQVVNCNRQANMKRMKWYVCPVCGNIVQSVGEIAVSCCGVRLPALEAEASDEAHPLAVEKMDGEYYVSIDHEMSKAHFISLLAYVTDGAVQWQKLYPEQSAEGRFAIRGHGLVFALCNRHGLFVKRI